MLVGAVGEPEKMTLLELWNAIQQFGAPFLLFIAVVMFLTGELVSGRLARRARAEEVNELADRYEDALKAFQTRFDEMQEVWKERCRDIGTDRDYYRMLTISLARQTQQGLSMAEIMGGSTPPPIGKLPGV